MMFLAVLLLAGVASADPPGMVAAPAPAAPPLQALQSAPARHSRLSVDVTSRGECFGFSSDGCMGGVQFGLGMKYGAVHAGLLFGASNYLGLLSGAYLVFRPFVGGEAGTRYYTLSRRRRFTFSIAGRASFDLAVGVAKVLADSDTDIGFINTFGPNLRFGFGGRSSLFLRGAIGYVAGGPIYTTSFEPSPSAITFTTELQLGLSIDL
jgi:hypothetical protein